MNLLTFFIIVIGYFIVKASGGLDEDAPIITKKSIPTPKKIDIDEQSSIESYIKARDILNAVDFERATRFDLYRLIDVLEEVEGSEVAEALKKADINLLRESLVEARDILNSKDLESKTTISTREFYKGTLTDEQMEEAEIKVNRVLNSDEEYDEDLDDINIETLGNRIKVGVPLAILSIGDKSTRIKKKRELVEKLEREHGFQRGYIPSWDTEERLYDKYKGDEEKYLDAKIVELQEKNLSHDMYLTDDEKNLWGWY